MLTEAEVLDRISQAHVLAVTGYAEAAGDFLVDNSSVEERIAVMCVVRNRVRQPGRFGDTFKAVCLKNNGRTWQYDCWRPGSGGNHDRLVQKAYLLVTDQPLQDPILDETLFLANGIVSGVILDRTNGATHYYAPKSMVPVNSKPRWVFAPGSDREIPPCAIVGTQRFYKGV